MVINITLHKINFSYYAPNCQECQLKSHDNRNLIKQYPRSTLMAAFICREYWKMLKNTHFLPMGGSYYSHMAFKRWVKLKSVSDRNNIKWPWPRKCCIQGHVIVSFPDRQFEQYQSYKVFSIYFISSTYTLYPRNVCPPCLDPSVPGSLPGSAAKCTCQNLPGECDTSRIVWKRVTVNT